MAAEPSELVNLRATAASLTAHIAARESRKFGQGDDYNLVTDRERRRLAEVQQSIKNLESQIKVSPEADEQAKAAPVEAPSPAVEAAPQPVTDPAK